MKPLILMLGMAAMAASAQPAGPPHVIGAPAGTGAWPAVAEGRADAPGYTIYRPATLPARRLPLVLWGNGGCRDNGLSASHFLREIASHGYIVIANGAPREETRPISQLPSEETGTPRAPAPPPPARPDETRTSQMLAAIDWAGQGAYRRNVDLSRIAVMGHSCGGLQALAAGADPRIRTVVAFNSGVYNRPTGGRSGVAITKADLRKLHTPVAYILGGPTDIAYPNGSDDVARIDHIPVFYANRPTGHGGTFQRTNGGDDARVARAWLDWQLKGDRRAGRQFTGASCGLCTQRDWTIVRKQFPEIP